MSENKNYYKTGVGQEVGIDDWVISNSILGYINPEQGGHPSKLLKYMEMNLEEIDSKSLDKGKLLHKYYEAPDDFVVSTVPKPNDKLGIAADKIINDTLLSDTAGELTDDIILKYVRAEGWNPKWGDEAVIKNTKDQIKPYVEEVLANQNKFILTLGEKITLENCKNAIQKNTKVKSLFYKNGDIVLSEYAIYWKCLRSNLNKKALLDKVIIDIENKKIIVNDLKTTSKPVSLFQYSFEKYHYYRQLAFYKEAIYSDSNLFEKIPNILDFSFEANIIVVETTGEYNSAIFPVNNWWLQQGLVEILALETRVNYHIETANWTIMREEMMQGHLSFKDKFLYNLN